MHAVLKVTLLAGLSALPLFSAGCARHTYGSNAAVSDEPLVIDPAMQQRDWDRSTAYYQNGDVKSWSTGFAYRPQVTSRWQYSFADTGTYFANLVTLPWTLYQERDGIVSEGERVAPTYTGVPPLPPSQETLAEMPTPTTQPTE